MQSSRFPNHAASGEADCFCREFSVTRHLPSVGLGQMSVSAFWFVVRLPQNVSVV